MPKVAQCGFYKLHHSRTTTPAVVADELAALCTDFLLTARPLERVLATDSTDLVSLQTEYSHNQGTLSACGLFTVLQLLTASEELPTLAW